MLKDYSPIEVKTLLSVIHDVLITWPTPNPKRIYVWHEIARIYNEAYDQELSQKFYQDCFEQNLRLYNNQLCFYNNCENARTNFPLFDSFHDLESTFIKPLFVNIGNKVEYLFKELTMLRKKFEDKEIEWKKKRKEREEKEKAKEESRQLLLDFYRKTRNRPRKKRTL